MNTLADPLADDRDVAELIRVRGLVQGVGFRPTVWLPGAPPRPARLGGQ